MENAAKMRKGPFHSAIQRIIIDMMDKQLPLSGF